jgi:hypothetical protein
VSERRTIDSLLSGSSLTGTGDKFDYRPTAVMPDVKVVKIGGQSVLDRGRAALFPILEEIVAARKLGIQVVLLAGGGTRARHIYSIASELEVPTGVVATLGKYIPMQNARMLQMLLAKHGGIYMLPDDFEKLPLYLQMGCIPIMSGMPPFGYWEKREEARASRRTAPTRACSCPPSSSARSAPSSSRTKTASTPTTPRRIRRRRTSRGSRRRSSSRVACPT